MKVTGDWLTHPGTQAFCKAMEAEGYKALFVGGCVRNALMGVAVGDVDLATDALPNIVTNIAQRAGFKVVPTGIDHGTVTVLAENRPLEVTTFRRDVETDGRRAVVAFSTRVEEDAGRRDLTMNALYSDTEGQIIDPLGGLADILARRVRFLGDAETRIREDYLRILRFFRFHACYGDPDAGLDADGLSACAALLAGIETISKERIGAEMRKLLGAANPALAIAAMAQTGVLAQVLPGASPRALAPLVHLEAGMPVGWLRRLVVLGGEQVKAALRLSREEAKTLGDLRDAVSGIDSPAVLGWRFGPKTGMDAVLARAALLEQPLPKDWESELSRGSLARFPVTAADLMPKFEDKALGAKLSALETRWLASGLRLGRDDLLDL